MWHPKPGHVKITYPRMRPLRAIAVIRFLKDLRRSEVEVTAYIHPDDLLLSMHVVEETADDDG